MNESLNVLVYIALSLAILMLVIMILKSLTFMRFKRNEIPVEVIVANLQD
jgi:hypothetical protein